MHRDISAFMVFLLIVLLAVFSSAAMHSSQSDQQITPGHSAHGPAFDTGPREKPWIMPGIGRYHFPITTSSPEAQSWFDQGNTLLHSFSFYEAERSFRWALKLDPDCAMCYWGMARAAGGGPRAIAFIREAVQHKVAVTGRERAYIEAWERQLSQEDDLSEEAKEERLRHTLLEICRKYPEDIEAKLLFALESLDSKDPSAVDAVLQHVLDVSPQNPGALHYRIHLWDKRDPARALSSNALYGNIATSLGHSQHVVGHIYSGLGMWHEAAIHMDSADRIELQYMNEHMVLPFHDWNYTHNRNYLCYLQEQLGMFRRAVDGARELLSIPLDPKYNNPRNPGQSHLQGLEALARVLVKFEEWDTLLDQHTLDWGSTFWEQAFKTYCETLAWIGKGDIEKAEQSLILHSQLKQQVEKPENNFFAEPYAIESAELQARLTLARGNIVEGLALLAEAARRDLEYRNSPATEGLDGGSVLYNTLGEAYLAHSDAKLAAAAFERTLQVIKNDGFALAGLVEAYAASGRRSEAQKAFGQLLFVWSDADPNLKWLERAKRWKFEAEPADSSPAPQRQYKSARLETFGPGRWESYPAPDLEARDATGKNVTLGDFKGKNVLAIFHPAGNCPPCMAQLVELGKLKKEFSALDTAIIEISGNKPQEIEAVSKSGIQVLSDPTFEDARKFHAYDDFEDIPLNLTAIIDKRGRLYWSREGSDPFTDFNFLLKAVRRMNGNLIGAE